MSAPSWMQWPNFDVKHQAVNSGPRLSSAPARPLKFNVTKAGETEFVTEDGWRTRLSIRIKSVSCDGRKNEGGKPMHLIEIEIVSLGRTRVLDELPDFVNSGYTPAGN